MSTLPHNAKTVDLLKWVAAHPNQPFDPNMVVSLSTNHTTDWEWQAVLGQMEDLRRQGYIMLLKMDGGSSTYWTITTSGSNYLRALESFEAPRTEDTETPKEIAAEQSKRQSMPAIIAPVELPAPTPKKYLWPFMERRALWIRHVIQWEDMPRLPNKVPKHRSRLALASAIPPSHRISN
jgi:hypothetical protein